LRRRSGDGGLESRAGAARRLSTAYPQLAAVVPKAVGKIPTALESVVTKTG